MGCKMIEAMYKNTIHVNNLRAGGMGEADFPIDVMPVYREPINKEYNWSTNSPMVEIKGRVISVRPDTGDVLGYHSKNYNITEHKPVIEVIRSSVERANVDATGIKESIKIANKGARMIYTLELPAHKVITPDGDSASLKFLGVNSFDGSFPLILSVGAHQWACDNGQIFTKDATSLYKSRHTKGLDIDQGARIISRGIEVLENESELWHCWAKKKVTSPINLIAKMLGISVDEDGLVTTRSTKYNYILDKYSNHYSRLMGNNYWALYNALTDWSTHAPTKGSKANVSLMRQRKVSDILDSFPVLDRLAS